MTAPAISRRSHAHIDRRPAIDALIRRVALGLLAWSDRRARKSQLAPERMSLLLENQRATRLGGSALGR